MCLITKRPIRFEPRTFLRLARKASHNVQALLSWKKGLARNTRLSQGGAQSNLVDICKEWHREKLGIVKNVLPNPVPNPTLNFAQLKFSQCRSLQVTQLG